MSTSSSSSASSAGGQGAAIPSSWRHLRGPLHQLIEFQGYRCALCREPFTWTGGKEPRQWVHEGLLWALVCYGCSRRHTGDRPAQADGMIARNLRQVMARPPGQECQATRGKGRQQRPRAIDSRVHPTEVPTTNWRYYGTIAHSLLLWQRGRCPICSTGLRVTTAPGYVHLDHNPVTDLIRGLLCRRCNVLLGKQEKGQLSPGWWEHHTPSMKHYLKHPPAKYLPATRGRSYRSGKQAAHITVSTDGGQILSDGLPVSILAPGVAAMQWRPTEPDDTDVPDGVDNHA